MSSIPQPRGPISEALLTALSGSPGPLAVSSGDIGSEDLQLALYCCYELHYRGFEVVDDAWEWWPPLLALRAELERRFDAELLDRVGPLQAAPAPEEIDVALRELMNADDGPSISRYIEREASREQVLEFMIHRSAYQLKEADPHSWAIPRLWGAPKAALIEIQADEYGGGRPDEMHAALFARALDAVGLDCRYGAYLDVIPGVTLATVNLMSRLGLHRARRGALVGHLALFEMTSAIPNRRYGAGLRRLGFGADVTAFFDVHVVADAVHESIAAVDLAGGLARQDPRLGADIMWGARALLALEGAWAEHLQNAWEADGCSLRVSELVLP